MELLEKRILLSKISWNINQSGDWSTPANWLDEHSMARVPAVGDDVVIQTSSVATITFNTNVQVNSLTVGSNDSLDLAGGTLTAAAGTSVNGGTLTINGGILARGAILTSGALAFSAGATGTLSATFFGTNQLSGPVTQGSTLTLQTNASFNTTVNTADGTVNNGTIALDSTRSDRTSTLTIAGTFTNNGTLEMANSANQGGGRTISGNLTSSGTIQIDAGVNATYQSGTLNDSGNITANGGLSLSSSTWNFQGGTVTVGNGSFVQANSSTVNFSGGATSGNVTLVDCTLDSTAASTTGAGFIYFDTSSANLLEGNLPQNTTVTLQTSAGFNTTVNVADGTVNNGTILLDSTRNDRTAQLSIAGTFTNSGTLEVANSGNQAGGRTISGNLTNNGTLQVDAGVNATYQNGTLNDSGNMRANGGLFLSNSTWNLQGGTVTVGSGSFIQAGGSMVNFSGGATSGNVTLLDSTLNSTAPSTTGAAFTFFDTSNTLEGTLPLHAMAPAVPAPFR